MSTNMNVEETIRAARATRAYADDPVPDDELEALIDAARRAGSGHNRQPWRFVASTDEEWVDELATFGDFTTPLQNAPAGIVIAVAETDSHYRLEHNVFDCGRGAQNITLTAAARGLGTCPQGLGDREGAADFLDLPDGFRPLMAYAVGYPADEPADEIEGTPKEEELHHPGREPVETLMQWADSE